MFASFSGGDLGLLIGRRGATIDAVQYLVNAMVYRRFGEDAKHVVVDAARYRERRRATLEELAAQAATRVRSSGDSFELEPMSAPERKIVHVRLQDEPGVETESEGVEPHRYVVVSRRVTDERLRRWLDALLSTPGLTAIRDPDEAWRVHVEQSLAALPSSGTSMVRSSTSAPAAARPAFRWLRSCPIAR